MSRKEWRKTKRKQKRAKGVRKFALALEVLVLSFFVIGGTDFPELSGSGEQVFATDREEEAKTSKADREEESGQEKPETDRKEQEDKEEQKKVTTPEFKWENYQVIAHALGGLEGQSYLNSRESFIESYEKGYRLFEVDLTKTSDEVWVCRHSWNTSMGQWEGSGKKELTLKEFLEAPLYGKYTPMTFEDLLVLLKDYPDAFVLLDSKQYSLRNYQKTIEDYSKYIEIAEKAGAAKVLGQLIPEIYNEAMFPGTAIMQKFHTYIYSMWQEYSEKELVRIGDFCKEKGIPAVTMYEKYWSEKAQKIFADRGILVYVYTVNDLEKASMYMEKGAAGICTDTITQKVLMSAMEEDRSK